MQRNSHGEGEAQGDFSRGWGKATLKDQIPGSQTAGKAPGNAEASKLFLKIRKKNGNFLSFGKFQEFYP